jgi:xanthine dehydrogenase YagS FAD-binding subunit
MKRFEYYSPDTVQEASDLLKNDNTVLSAGATDLIRVLKDKILPDYPKKLVSIKHIKALNFIREESDGIHIGAVTTLREIIDSALIQKQFPALAAAAYSVSSPNIRNSATIGGNLCQDTNCWYYRAPHLLGGRLICSRKGGELCLAAEGENRYHSIFGSAPVCGKNTGCISVNTSDMANILIAYDAAIKTNFRIVSANELLTTKAQIRDALQKGEIITEIIVPRYDESTTVRYDKYRLRKTIDFAIVAAASLYSFDAKGAIADARIVIGAVNTVPHRPIKAEKYLLGKKPSEQVANEAGNLALDGAVPLKYNAYKMDLVKTMIIKSLKF